jgi:outer membrane receptor for ferric coprogen and ferric-rhodotorulic acid
MSNISSRGFKLSIISLAILSAQYSFAQDAQSLATITVQATADQATESSEQSKSYIVQQSISATKLNIPLKETPQTVNVVTRQQLDDFALNSTREVLRNVPGVIVSNQETDRTTYLARGFEISNVLVDGVGFSSRKL